MIHIDYLSVHYRIVHQYSILEYYFVFICFSFFSAYTSQISRFKYIDVNILNNQLYIIRIFIYLLLFWQLKK